MGTLLARNATILVTMDDQRRELPGAGLFARDGVIEQVGPSAELPSDADVVLELPGHLVLPGLVNCHHHLDQVLTRNLPAGQNTNLFPWLRAHYRLWGRRTPPASRTATIVGLAELALSGATTVFDHAYMFGNGCRGRPRTGSRLRQRRRSGRRPGSRCRTCKRGRRLSLIHISEPTRLGMISY